MSCAASLQGESTTLCCEGCLSGRCASCHFVPFSCDEVIKEVSRSLNFNLVYALLFKYIV